jgi:hypothetical protein
MNVNDILASVPSPIIEELPAPDYLCPPSEVGCKVGMAVSSMRDHMTDEGWQIFAGLESAGYLLTGSGFSPEERRMLETCCGCITGRLGPDVVVMQDKREWDVQPGDFRDPAARFTGLHHLKRDPCIFKMTILKDAHQKPQYHRESADEIGCHGWIIYYHPRIVKHVAPYIRLEHCVRTWHSIDKTLVPEYRASDRRNKALVSGAISAKFYPLRTQLFTYSGNMDNCDFLNHPGYHRQGCHTPGYLRTLSGYKVAVCTSSIFGYALRKIIEATACGCKVITNLPADERLPFIDDNLVRLPDQADFRDVRRCVQRAIDNYNPIEQEVLSDLAKECYDYHRLGSLLATDIEKLRRSYNGDASEGDEGGTQEQRQEQEAENQGT